MYAYEIPGPMLSCTKRVLHTLQTSNSPRACTGTILIGYGKHVVDSTGPGLFFTARGERFGSFRPAQAESGSPRLPGIRSPWSWETWPGIPKKRCLQGMIVACVSGFFQAHAAVGLPCTVPGHGGPKAVQTGQNCGDIRHTSKVGVHINPLGDLIVWVNGEQANVCILISGSPPETLRGFAGPSDCHQPHGGQSK